jgi:hypothetical protein
MKKVYSKTYDYGNSVKTCLSNFSKVWPPAGIYFNIPLITHSKGNY